jgi:hypothetical protein
MREIKPIDRAIATARREQYVRAYGTPSAEMRDGIRRYRLEFGPVEGEALVCVRMMRNVRARRRGRIERNLRPLPGQAGLG